MELLPFLTITIKILLIIFILLLGYLVIECIKIVKNLRKVADRVEFLTDLKSWLGLARKFPRRSKKS
jgi:hypothetical protein